MTSITSVNKRPFTETLTQSKKRKHSKIFELSELIENKFCILRGVLESQSITKILEGSVTWKKQVSQKRTLDKEWKGCVNLTDQELKFFSFVKLPDGRIDISLPHGLASKIIDLNEAALLRELPEGFRIVHYNLLINPTNPNMQQWHQDNGGVPADDYYTLLLPLVDEKDMGKTEVCVPYTQKFSKKAIVITPDVTIGDGLLFSGSLWHRGTPNLSKMTRYCIYLILSRSPKEKLFEDWK